jgi:hypothetical protein
LFWAGLLVGTVFAFFVPFPWIVVPLLVALGGLVGVLRRRRYRSGANFLVIPQPVAPADGDLGGRQAQQLIMESLAHRLTADELALVRPIPARLGTTDVSLAGAVLRRLGAFQVLVGRINPRPDGGWSLYSGLVSLPERNVIHLDPHTRDKTPARTRWALALDYLSSTQDVQDVQDPLLVSNELEAVVRSLAGHVASLGGDLPRAEREFRAAIEASGNSDSHPIDELRCALARVLVHDNRRSEAVAELRARVGRDNPSPELLRTFARYLPPQPGEFREHLPYPESADDQADAIAALRQAAAQRSDPRRPMTLYNLSQILPAGEERRETLAEAMGTSRFYRQAWYTHKALGASHYQAAVAQVDAGDEPAARELFRSAACEYRSALRRRPKLRLLLRDGGTVHVYTRFPSSPVLHANARDACEGAGQPRRARWHLWRARRLRRARLKRANKAFDRKLWARAYASYDFAVLGWDGLDEAYALVMRSVCLQQMGHPEEAAADFGQADARFPALALAVRAGCVAPGMPELPNGLPGDWPTALEDVTAMLRARGLGPPT